MLDLVRTATVEDAGCLELTALCEALEQVVDNSHPFETAIAVKAAIERAVRQGNALIPQRFMEPVRDRYARRLIYMGKDRRFSLLAMVWDRGQGTPLHDHGGAWCVECIYQGTMRSTSYLLEGEIGGLCRFRKKTVSYDIAGEANVILPPLEHHVFDNPGDVPAVTLHVYENELTSCNAYFPTEGGYIRKLCNLTYTE
jgi:predicted metal-dependent enzyme (double-stranded beta helix superfamily)